MLDYRIYTFLKLCETMNYRITAEQLNMTQPAVTQHIQFLESELNCRLFNYNRRKLKKTEQAGILENYARSAVYNEIELKKRLTEPAKKTLRIGATKTIGDYVINEQICQLSRDKALSLTLVIDNTQRLLSMLEQSELDFAIVEGFFDKTRYDYTLYRNEDFVGICNTNHRFAGKNVSLEEILKERVILREEGSGTRAVFEQLLNEHNFNTEHIENSVVISSFIVIKELVKAGTGVSFVYKSIADSDKELAVFAADCAATREFNFVYLKNTQAGKYIELFK